VVEVALLIRRSDKPQHPNLATEAPVLHLLRQPNRRFLRSRAKSGIGRQ
jgi:hypothetical protein